MPEQNPPSMSEYQRVLTNILNIAQKNHLLWDDTAYISGVLPLFSRWICEQDEDAVYYGIRKNKEGKLVFCYIEGGGNNPFRIDQPGIQTSMQDTLVNLQRSQIPLEKLIADFLKEIETPIRRYETLNAGIQEKVRRKLKNLEAELA